MRKMVKEEGGGEEGESSSMSLNSLTPINMLT